MLKVTRGTQLSVGTVVRINNADVTVSRGGTEFNLSFAEVEALLPD
jgi:hypothetical protein